MYISVAKNNSYYSVLTWYEKRIHVQLLPRYKMLNMYGMVNITNFANNTSDIKSNFMEFVSEEFDNDMKLKERWNYYRYVDLVY